MTLNFLGSQFIYLKSEMTELDQGLDTQMSTGQVGNLHGWVPRVRTHVYILETLG